MATTPARVPPPPPPSTRDWFDVREAAQAMTITTVELLRLALEGEVPLCVYLPAVETSPVTREPASSAAAAVTTFEATGDFGALAASRTRQPQATPHHGRSKAYPPITPLRGFISTPIPVSPIDGLWDLPLQGLARAYVGRLYADQRGFVAVPVTDAPGQSGLIVTRGDMRRMLPRRDWTHVAMWCVLAVRRSVVNKGAAGHGPLPPASSAKTLTDANFGIPETRKVTVSAFLERLTSSGALGDLVQDLKKVEGRPVIARENMIWQAAGHRSQNSFLRWKRGEASQKANKAFRQVLELDPHAFVATWKLKMQGKVHPPRD